MKISLAWLLLIRTNPIRRSTRVKILKWLVPWAFMTELICMGPQLLETKECLIATLESIFFIITLISIDYCNCGSVKCPLVLERNHFGKILWCLYHSQLKYIQYGIQCMSEFCCNKEHILKYHMILWQRWDHGSSSVANYQIINCGFEHFINYCDFIWLSQISFVCVNKILWNS